MPLPLFQPSDGRVMHDAVAFADPAPRENVLYVTHCDGYVIDESRTAQFQAQLVHAPWNVAKARR